MAMPKRHSSLYGDWVRSTYAPGRALSRRTKVRRASLSRSTTSSRSTSFSRDSTAILKRSFETNSARPTTIVAQRLGGLGHQGELSARVDRVLRRFYTRLRVQTWLAPIHTTGKCQGQQWNM